MLNVPPPTRAPIGTAQIAGKTFEVFATPEWARYFQALNTQTVNNTSASTTGQVPMALMADVAEAPDVFPGPPGPAGRTGDPGLALFMLQDSPDEQAMLTPPVADGVYVPITSKDAKDGVPALTGFKLNLKNAAGTITSWFTTAATAVRTWTLPDKDGTVALLVDFAAPPAIGNTTPAAAAFTALKVGISSTAGQVQLARASDGAALTVLAIVGNDVQIDSPPGDVVTLRGSVERIRATATGATVSGAATVTGGFGCNGKSPQTAAASGGTLAGVIAALVANGILSS